MTGRNGFRVEEIESDEDDKITEDDITENVKIAEVGNSSTRGYTGLLLVTYVYIRYSSKVISHSLLDTHSHSMFKIWSFIVLLLKSHFTLSLV